MKITSDWHIHTRNSCDTAEGALSVSQLIIEASERGITDLGITDHYHGPYSLKYIIASRKEFVESEPPPRFHFGVEVSCISQWELDQMAAGLHEPVLYGRVLGAEHTRG